MEPQRNGIRRPTLALFVVVALTGCTGVAGPEHASDPMDPTPTFSNPRPILGAAVVSDPVVAPPGSAQGSSSTGPVVYVSLPSGSVPGGEQATIESPSTGARLTVTMVDGGFDPVAVEARAGEALDLDIQMAEGGALLTYAIIVPERRPPVVVRTDPPPKKRDVPLNAVMLVVFSEPVREGSLQGSIRLATGGPLVPGTVAFADEAHLTVTFTPAIPLAGDTEYALVVTQAITDLDGEPLEAAVVVDFATAGGAPGLSEVYGRLSPVSVPGQYSRYVLYEDGRFELQFEMVQWGATLGYSGRYTRWDSQVGFVFIDNPGRWWATGTLQGDSLIVAYNVEMGLDDFEDGVYLREGASVEGWASVAPMPGPRWQMSAVSLNGVVYVAGGVVDDGTGWVAPPEILAYDPDTDTWRAVGDLIHPVRDPAVAAVGDRIYVIGGHRDNPWEPIANLQIFDPAAGTVTEGAPLSFGRGGARAVVLDGRIHVIGGTYQWAPDDMMGERTDSHDVLDPGTGEWSSLAPLPYARSGHGAAVLDGRIYVAGGQGEYVLQVYDPATDSWAVSFNAPPPRFGTAAATLGGKVYLFGGAEYPGCCVGTYPTTTVDRYDPATGTWDQVTPMITARDGHAAAVVAGSVYVIGGSPGGATAALVANERFVPSR